MVNTFKAPRKTELSRAECVCSSVFVFLFQCSLQAKRSVSGINHTHCGRYVNTNRIQCMCVYVFVCFVFRNHPKPVPVSLKFVEVAVLVRKYLAQHCLFVIRNSFLFVCIVMW